MVNNSKPDFSEESVSWSPKKMDRPRKRRRKGKLLLNLVSLGAEPVPPSQQQQQKQLCEREESDAHPRAVKKPLAQQNTSFSPSVQSQSDKTQADDGTKVNRRGEAKGSSCLATQGPDRCFVGMGCWVHLVVRVPFLIRTYGRDAVS